MWPQQLLGKISVLMHLIDGVSLEDLLLDGGGFVAFALLLLFVVGGKYFYSCDSFVNVESVASSITSCSY